MFVKKLSFTSFFELLQVELDDKCLIKTKKNGKLDDIYKHKTRKWMYFMNILIKTCKNSTRLKKTCANST